jgi:hypothetical protein
MGRLDPFAEPTMNDRLVREADDRCREEIQMPAALDGSMKGGGAGV